MAISHAGHDHPATAAGRRACRAGTTTPVIKENAVRKLAEAAFLVPNRARQRSSDAVRIQPRRTGARATTGPSTCPQAALHIDAHGGRCACGWKAKK